MKDCKIYPDLTGDMQVQISDALDITGATRVKAFIWGSMETLVPVCDCVEAEL